MTQDFLTILHGDQPAAKQVKRSSNDGYDVLPAGTSFRHSVASVSVTSLSDLDHALFNPVQVHYTANPILAEDISDPIKNRLGLYTPKDGKESISSHMQSSTPT